MREDTTVCTFVKLMPKFGFKALMAEFALKAFQTCLNSTWQALMFIHRNTLQTKLTIHESYDSSFVTKTRIQQRHIWEGVSVPAEQWRCVTDKVITIEQSGLCCNDYPIVKAAQSELNESDGRPHRRRNSVRPYHHVTF